METGVDAQIETKHCPICSQDIDASKFRMHEMGCARQNYKCKTCGQCVAKADREEHEEDCLKEIVCEHCNVKVFNYELETHNRKCEMQPLDCQFCGKKIKITDFENHTSACGGKTSKCELCDEYVK